MGRRNEPRKLVRWDSETDMLCYLAIPRVMAKRGIKFPWGEVAAYIGDHVSGNALLQHMSKETKKRAKEGRPVPENRETQVKGPSNYQLISAAGFGDRRTRAMTDVPTKRSKSARSDGADDDEEEEDDDEDDAEGDTKHAAGPEKLAGRGSRALKKSNTNVKVEETDDDPDADFIPANKKRNLTGSVERRPTTSKPALPKRKASSFAIKEEQRDSSSEDTSTNSSPSDTEAGSSSPPKKQRLGAPSVTLTESHLLNISFVGQNAKNTLRQLSSSSEESAGAFNSITSEQPMHQSQTEESIISSSMGSGSSESQGPMQQGQIASSFQTGHLEPYVSSSFDEHLYDSQVSTDGYHLATYQPPLAPPLTSAYTSNVMMPAVVPMQSYTLPQQNHYHPVSQLGYVNPPDVDMAHAEATHFDMMMAPDDHVDEDMHTSMGHLNA